MFGQGFNSGFFGGPPCFTDTTDIFKDNSGVALYTLDYDASSGKDITTNTLQILGDTSCFAAYPLDGSSADLSGNYNGTDTSVTYTSGYFDQSASFNGSSSFITLPGSMLNSRTAISASAWVYRRTGSSDAYEYVIAGGDNVSGGRYGIAVNDAGSGSTDNKFYLSDGAASYNTNTVCAYNTWYHVVLTWAGTEMKFYVNGSLDSTFTAASCNFQSSGNGHKIGEYFYNGTYEWEGEIDQVRLFNKAISASEVTILYNEIGRRDGTPTNVDFGVGGKSLYGARFNGSNSAIIVPNNILASNNHSVSMWFYLDDTTGTQTLIEFDYGNRIIFRVASTDSNWAYIGSSGYFNHGISFSAGQWYHLAITFSAGSPFKIYVNGNLSYTGGNTNLYLRTADNIIGAGNSSGANCVDGTIDQVRLFNKALSAAEISKLYGGGAGEIACTYTSTTDNVAYPIANTAYYKLDNNSKDSAKSTGKFNEGAVFNGSSSQIATGLTLPADSSMSFSFWLKSASNSSGNNYFLSDFDSAGSNNSSRLSLAVSTNNGLRIWMSNGSSNWNSTDAIDLSSYINLWMNLVVVINGTDIKVYINGGTPTTLTSTVSFGTAGSRQQYIGGVGGNNGASYEGSIDQVRIFDKSLSSSEVSTLYNETKNTTNTLQILGDSSCIATYQLDGNSTDLSGNYNGTDTNITYAYDGTEYNIEYRFGRFGQAAVFNGSSSKIVLPNSSLGITDASNFSFSCWFNTNSLTQDNQSIIWTNGSNAGARFGVGINSTSQGGDTSVYFGVGASSFTYINSGTSAFAANTWVHVVGVKSSTTGMSLYVDNVLKATNTGATGAASSTATGDNRIGGYKTTAESSWFNGSIDQVRIYSTALTSSQVTELYNEKPEVDTSNFKAVLYTGNADTDHYISNVGFQPDLVWVKNRSSSGNNHALHDSVRGVQRQLRSDTTGAENNYTSTNYSLKSYDANGFTVGDTTAGIYNVNGAVGGTYSGNAEFVAWVWKGGGDAVTGTGSGVTNVSVSTNTDAGFSIVKYTGGNSVSNTVNHGLTDAEMIILKDLSDGTNNWRVWHKDLTSGYWLYLNLTNAQANAATDGGIRNVDSNSFGFINGTTQGIEGVNSSASNYIAYVWKSIAGYSKMGSYSGTGGSGNIQTVGFRPSLVVIKRTNTGGSGSDHWLAFTSNVLDANGNINMIRWDTAQTEFGGAQRITFQDTSFTLTDSDASRNATGGNYIYMAFK